MPARTGQMRVDPSDGAREVPGRVQRFVDDVGNSLAVTRTSDGSLALVAAREGSVVGAVWGERGEAVALRDAIDRVLNEWPEDKL